MIDLGWDDGSFEACDRSFYKLPFLVSKNINADISRKQITFSIPSNTSKRWNTNITR